LKTNTNRLHISSVLFYDRVKMMMSTIVTYLSPVMAGGTG